MLFKSLKDNIVTNKEEKACHDLVDSGTVSEESTGSQREMKKERL